MSTEMRYHILPINVEITASSTTDKPRLKQTVVDALRLAFPQLQRDAHADGECASESDGDEKSDGDEESDDKESDSSSPPPEESDVEESDASSSPPPSPEESGESSDESAKPAPTNPKKRKAAVQLMVVTRTSKKRPIK